jgi:glycosyltransferase involved in cell wall biosynthesis
MRVDNMVRGLTQAGSVDFFCTISERPDVAAGTAPTPPFLARLHVHHRPPFGPSPGGLVRWARSGWPRAIAWREWADAESALTAWAEPPYDVVWFSACGSWVALGQVDRGPAIVDLDNLEDQKLRTLMRVARLQKREGLVRRSPLQRLRRILGALLDPVDVRRWERVQQRAADEAVSVVVASERDRVQLGHSSAVVVPNGYELASTPPAYVPPPEPVFTMVGLLTYPPNIDAAQFFARRVFPLVRASLPSARFRLVGRSDGSIVSLADHPGVELLGEVDELDDVFATTTAVVVPLRAGGGTRLKVLEAFARKIPVVSTSLGCEGLDARDGFELLTGERPEELAAACVRLAVDTELAAAMAESGYRLWSSRYRWQDIRLRVRDLAAEAARSWLT